jgi:uncharacterized membrane protein YeiB
MSARGSQGRSVRGSQNRSGRGTSDAAAGASAPTGPPAPRSPRERIVALDVLRGFALCGILLANVKPIAHRSGQLGPAHLGSAHHGETTAATVLHLAVDQRFFPIFSLLFGMGFSLIWRAAQERSRRPRLVLVRRLLALLALGLLHSTLLWKGDVLAVYATLGLLVLLPATWLPRRTVAIVAGALVVLSVTLLGGWYSLIPGLFLLGSALTRYGIVDSLERYPRRTAVLGLVFAVAAAPATVVQLRAGSVDPDGAAFRIAYPAAGLLTAGAYVCGLLLLLRTRLARPLTTAFTPLGRMALTHYLTATVLVLAVARGAGDTGGWSPGDVVLVAAAVLLVQWTWSVLWLRRHRQGPLEWLWRQVTWWPGLPGRRPLPGARGLGSGPDRARKAP